MTRVGVVLFPGSNCEQDVLEAVRNLGAEGELLWHGDATSARYVDAYERVTGRSMAEWHGTPTP